MPNPIAPDTSTANPTIASEVRVGDKMDLEHDGRAFPLLTDVDLHVAECELFAVCQVEHRAGRCYIGWEGIGGLADYLPEDPVIAELGDWREPLVEGKEADDPEFEATGAYAVTIAVHVSNPRAVFAAAYKHAVETDNLDPAHAFDLLMPDNGDDGRAIDVGACLTMLLDPGASPDGMQIKQTDTERDSLQDELFG